MTTARLLAVVHAAIEILREDREALFDSSVNRRTGTVDDSVCASIVATFDAVIAELEEAVKEEEAA